MDFIRQHLHLRIRAAGLLVASIGFGTASVANDELATGAGMFLVLAGCLVGILGALLLLGGPLQASSANVSSVVETLGSRSKVNVVNALPRPEHSNLIVGFWLVGIAGSAAGLIRGEMGVAAAAIIGGALASGLVWAHAFGTILSSERRARRIAAGLAPRSDRDWIGLSALSLGGFVAGFFGSAFALERWQVTAGSQLVLASLGAGLAVAFGILGAGYRWNWTPRGWDAELR